MMMESEIKLFGRKISLLEYGRVVAGGEYSGDSSDVGGGRSVDCYQNREADREKADGEVKQEQINKDKGARDLCETNAQDESQKPVAVLEPHNIAISESDNNPKTPSIGEDSASADHPETKDDQADAQKKTLKKPDKILPCPRCNSMDTKFCYYNNYNVNQPRHFCKSCQRYWTAGGTTRNVPVGAGRRKNKNPVTQCRHITISEALRIDGGPNGLHQLEFKPNGTVLSFGPYSPPCESMVEKEVLNGVRNGYYQRGSISCCKNEKKGDDCSMRSSVTTSNSETDESKKGLQMPLMQSINGLPGPFPSIPGAPWPLVWNSAFPLPAPISPAGYPMAFYPGPYWNCGSPNAWNVPWLSNSSSNSSLGKHSRNGELLKPNNEPLESKSSESSIVVPKTLRIDNPEEAAKSSIWTTLGIKYDSSSREGLFKALQPKGDLKKPTVTSSPLLQANPAALSRSISFQERA